MKFSNSTLEAYKTVLESCLGATNIVGFAVAHNYRVINDAIADYLSKKQEIIIEYGEDIGNGMYSVTDEEKIVEATNKIDEYGKLKVDCDIMKVPEDAFRDCGLTAKDIINLQIFMMEEDTPEDDDSRFDI